MNNPQIGEYVICDEGQKYGVMTEFMLFLQQNIGKIVDIDNNKYEVKYENIPDILRERFYKGRRLMEIHEIKHHSYNIEDLKAILSGNKYNL